MYDALRLQDAGILWLILRDECVNRVPRQTLRRLYTRTRRRIEARQFEADFQALAELESLPNHPDAEFYEAYRSLDYPDEPPRGDVATYMRMAIIFRRKNENLEAKNKRLEEQVEALSGADDSEPVEASATAETRQFKMVKDAVAEANGALDGLRFFPTAFDSAERSQFRRPAEVYRAFEVLAECAKARGKGTLGISVTQWLADRSVEYAAGESQPTEDKYGDDRTFCGVYMPAHVKIGGGELRIHLCWEKSASGWLIGHVGAHLPTSRYDG